jgi:glucan phosphoethanolaminetransferase (alkaline phosphatase superfamily)
LFREAGFDTYWISNQARAGGAGSPIGQISAEAAHSFWLNESANDVFGNSSHDEVVLPVLARVLARDEPKQFIVVHLMGSHDSYERRYPSRFNHFHPSLSDDPERTGSSPHDVRYLRNAYDNSIFYTDYVIAQLLDQLQQSGALAAAFYTSDHGESLLDGSCTARGHGGSAEEQYEVSALAWLSQRYQQQFPDALAVLRAHAKAPLSTVNVFSSLADLAHIRYRGDDPSLSIFSAAFRPHPRVVNVRGRVVNFDTAPHLGACREP